MAIAFLFPGQGSQKIGMLSDYAKDFLLVRELFSEASDILGYDLWKLISEGPETKLSETTYTQPAILTASIALFRVWEEQQGEQPVILAGHSLGEYSAYVTSDAISFRDAVLLVAQRGALMQAAVKAGEGAMAAILGLSAQDVIAACEDAAQNEVVSAVNFNSPEQVVIAGHAAAVTRAMENAKSRGAKRAILLPVSVPSHCALMFDAAQSLKNILDSIDIQTPDIPVVNNVDAKIVTDSASIKDALVRQLYSPVKWVNVIEYIASTGVDKMIECGPGKVLSGLNKRIVKDIPCFATDTLNDMTLALNN